MTITDTRQSAEPQVAATGAERPERPEPTGLAAILGSGHHAVVGRLYIAFALAFGVATLVLGGLAMAETIGDGGVLPDDTAFQVYTLAQVSGVLFFLLPLMLGIALVVVPLQVGASTVAFPRAASASLWAWLVGAGLATTGWAVNGGVAGGSAEGVELTMLGLMMVIAALILGAVCVVTTVLTLRVEGMTLERTPFFAWSLLVAGTVWVLTLPVLAANLVLVWLDHRNGAVFMGAADQQWPQLQWAFVAPQIWVVAIPVLGALADVVPALARRRQAMRGLVLFALGAFGALAVGMWAQPAMGGGVYDNGLFVFVSFAIALPLFMLVAAWIITVLRGEATVASPLLAGFASVAVLLLAALLGGLFSIEPLNVQQVLVPGYGVPAGALGVANLVVGATIAGAVGVLVWWAPKITGHRISDGLGKLLALVLLLGALLYGLPIYVAGWQDRFTGLADANDVLAGVTVAGAAVLLAGLLLTVVGLLASVRGDDDGSDPWGSGQTLEWAAASPAGSGPAAVPAAVASAEPLVDGTTASTEEEDD